MLAPWILPAGRAAPRRSRSGLAITFTGGHTATFGLVAFGVFAVLSRAADARVDRSARAQRAEARTAFRRRASCRVVAGIAALVLPTGGIGYLVWVLSGWAIVTGALELVSGIRARGRAAALDATG